MTAIAQANSFSSYTEKLSSEPVGRRTQSIFLPSGGIKFLAGQRSSR